MPVTDKSLLTAALEFLQAGLSFIPCRMPDKTPDFRLLPRTANDKPTWEPFKFILPTREQAHEWFANPDDQAAIGLIAGKVSGNLEILDIDNADYVPAWVAVIKEENPALLKRLVVERTVRGRAHVIYRVSHTVPGSQKLAKAIVQGRAEGIFETKGEGGYAVVSPSPGYELLKGEIAQLPVLTTAERELIILAARSFNSCDEIIDAPPPPAGAPVEPGDRPGDEYNREANVRTLLESHGWTLAHERGSAQYWRRPGKDRAWSATWNHVPGGFHVFTSNAPPLDYGKTYSPFALYALLEHQGDFSRAATELRSAGYGRPLSVLPGYTPNPDRPKPQPPEQDTFEQDADLALDPAESEPEPPIQIGQVLPLPAVLSPLDDNAVIQCAIEGERGLGALVAALFRGKFVFDHAAGCWYQWDQHYWAECRKAEHLAVLVDAQTILKNIARRKRKNDKNSAQILIQAADSLRRLVVCQHVLQFAAAGVNGVGIRGDEWDTNGWLLPCPNGTVDLQTGEFRPGLPSDYARTICPTNYDEHATAPRWEQFIREIMPDPDIAAFLARLLGYGITGRSTEHVFPVFLGQSSRNGKGTLMETLGFVLGALARPLPAKTLLAQNFQETHDAQAMMLRGRRLMWASETGDRQRLDAARVKLWTGGDTISGRAPYARSEVSFKATHKIILLSNFKPRLSADDKAMWNRILLVSFTETFVDNPDPADPHQHLRDRTLMDALAQERQGILRWLVRGCREWATIGLLPPQAIKVATVAYQAEEDVIAQFMADCTTPANNDILTPSDVSSKDVFERYKAWMNLQGEKPMGAARFVQAMERKGYKRAHTRTGNRYIGFSLKEEEI